MIKYFDQLPIEREQEDVKMRATQEDYQSFYDMRKETLSKFDDRETVFNKSKIKEIDIDYTTVKSVRKIVEAAFNGIDDDEILKEKEIHAFYTLLDQLDEIDYIDGFMAKRAIEKVEGSIANDFSIVTQVRWQGRALLFPGDLLNWNYIKHKIHSLDFLKIPHHGGFGNYLEDHELLSRMFPTNQSRSIIPTCFPNNCSTSRMRPDPRDAMNKLDDYSLVVPTSHFPNSFHDFVIDPN